MKKPFLMGPRPYLAPSCEEAPFLLESLLLDISGSIESIEEDDNVLTWDL